MVSQETVQFVSDLTTDLHNEGFIIDYNPRLVPTRIAEVYIGPDHIVISEHEQDDAGHAETLAHWLSDAGPYLEEW